MLHKFSEFAWSKPCKEATPTAASETPTHSSNEEAQPPGLTGRQKHFSRGLLFETEKYSHSIFTEVALLFFLSLSN